MIRISHILAGILLSLSLLSQPAHAVDPVKGNPTKEDVLAEMKRVNIKRAGLGDDEGQPNVTPINLPAGLQIAGEAVGPNENGECPDDNEISGAYRDVQICLPVCTIGNNATNVIFPPGLVITTAAEGFQNGLLVTREVVAVPPIVCNSGPPSVPEKKKRKVAQDESSEDDSREDEEIATWQENALPKSKVYWVKLSAFCLNESQNPSSVEGRYNLAGVTADPDLLDLATFISKRDLSSEKANKVAQKAIYSITEGKGLTWQDRKDLYEIPLLGA